MEMHLYKWSEKLNNEYLAVLHDAKQNSKQPMITPTEQVSVSEILLFNIYQGIKSTVIIRTVLIGL